ncbi:MAG TPA: hypothetical protein VGG10_13185 [Rhizomicrobium sp.]|jgi:hypothetical protein
MGKTILGTAVGIVVWMATALVLGLLLGKLWPALAVASRAPLTLTTAMLSARLGVSFIGSLVSGAVSARLGGMNAAIAAGVLLLLGWGTFHVTVIWHQFPIWYHLTFFVSLVVLSWVGGRLARAG